MIITRPINHKEIDLLTGNTDKVLHIYDLDGVLIRSIKPPNEGWDHDKLEAIDYESIAPYGWDCYLKAGWIGSSEV